jgi:hypothetical protein
MPRRKSGSDAEAISSESIGNLRRELFREDKKKPKKPPIRKLMTEAELKDFLEDHFEWFGNSW